jgi:hypothetical protein
VGDHAAAGLLDRADDRRLVERLQRPGVDDLDGDALLLGFLRGRERLVHEPARRNDRDVFAFAMNARLAERDRLELVGYLLLQAVEGAVLEEDHWVVVVDRRPEQAANVARSRREDDLQPGDVDEPGLQLLRVLCPRRPAGAALRPGCGSSAAP